MIKCFCAAWLDPQWRSIKSTICKMRGTMAHLTRFDESCVFECTNEQVSATRNEPSSANYLRIDLEETNQYASTLKAALRGYTLRNWSQANRMSFDVNSTSCTDPAEFDCPQVDTKRVACC